MPNMSRVGMVAVAGVLTGATWFGVRVDSSVTHVRVLAMTDFHGALESRPDPSGGDRRLGGVAVLKTAMDEAAAECDCISLRVDAGDQMQGTLISNLTYGASTVAALNLLELDAAAIGNHGFDWSVDTLRQRIEEAEYEWLAANVFDSVSGERSEWAKPYHIADLPGLRVAYIGFVTSGTKQIVYAPRAAGLSFGSGRDAIADILEQVRAENPDLTILTAHAAARCDDAGCTGEIISLAQELEPGDVDLIVAGHPHQVVTTEVNGIPIVQAGAHGSALGVVDLFRDGRSGWRAELEVRRLYTDDFVPDARLQDLVLGYSRAADSLSSRSVATLAEAPTSESQLGNIIADGLRASARSDVALINYGGIRAPLPAGPITYGLLYAVMPFDNQLVRLTISGAELSRLLEQALGRVSASGVEVTFDPDLSAGSRILNVRFTDGRLLDESGSYTLAVGKYLAEGGDGYTVLLNLPREDVGMRTLDALIAHMREAPQPFALPSSTRFAIVN